jgi:FixJ family two-component response regulator
MNQLTHQEQKIVALVTQGLTNKQVAQRIGTIASYAIDLEQGRIAYAVLSVGAS